MVRLANSRAPEVIEGLKAALERHATSRVAARVKRHSQVAAQSGAPGRSVTVLPSAAIIGEKQCPFLYTSKCTPCTALQSPCPYAHFIDPLPSTSCTVAESMSTWMSIVFLGRKILM